jgi:hypothetical protein
VLVVTSSKRVLYWVFSNTTNLGPAVTLDSILVVGISSLEKWLIGTSTSSYNSDLSTDKGRHSLLSSRRKAETSGSLIFVVRNNNGKSSGSASKRTTVTNLGLNVADNGSLGNCREGEDISYGKSGLLSTVNELTGVHTLRGDHEFVVPLVTVSVEELDAGNGGTTTGIVQDLLDDSADISVLLSIVNRTKLHGSLASAGVSLEDGRLTLPLCL